VELSGKVRPMSLVGNALVTAIVGIGKESLPSGAKSVAINDVSVILGSNVAFSRLRWLRTG
jgi:hypothetical protein